ncbi:MAG TPA: hypothetical protein VJP80_04905 [Candidatus Saccharimonadales bacterium]|nr:hypothetical protein [Candidatus Saccharimonadales bacterium]
MKARDYGVEITDSTMRTMGDTAALWMDKQFELAGVTDVAAAIAPYEPVSPTVGGAIPELVERVAEQEDACAEWYVSAASWLVAARGIDDYIQNIGVSGLEVEVTSAEEYGDGYRTLAQEERSGYIRICPQGEVAQQSAAILGVTGGETEYILARWLGVCKAESEELVEDDRRVAHLQLDAHITVPSEPPEQLWLTANKLVRMYPNEAIDNPDSTNDAATGVRLGDERVLQVLENSWATAQPARASLPGMFGVAFEYLRQAEVLPQQG